MTMYLTVGSTCYPDDKNSLIAALCTLGLAGLGSSEAFISAYMGSPAEPELGGTWSGRKSL